MMLKRRTVLGAGLALAAATCTAGFAVCGATTRRQPQARSIDALLVDETIELPSRIAAFINSSRRTLPVVGVRFDAAAHASLMRVMDASHVIQGISSGATLFCLERLAWDHGFRLTARSQRCDGDFGDNACRQEVAAFLTGANSSAASPASLLRAYRPSRADATLHAWVMQKTARSQVRHDRREA